jgi:hypothetical protein
MNDPVLRVGILTGRPTASSALRDFIERAHSSKAVRIEHLVPATTASRPNRARLSDDLFHAWGLLERALMRRSGKYRAHADTFPLRTLVDSVIELPQQASPDGLRVAFDAADVERVRALGLDLLLHFDGPEPEGALLDAARLGTISVRRADAGALHGDPPGFWEVFHRADTTGFAIVQLRQAQRGAAVLLKGRFATRHYHLLNQAVLDEKVVHHLATLLTRIAQAGRLPAADVSLPESVRPRGRPGVFEIAAYAQRFFAAMFGKKLRRLGGLEERWQVSFASSPWREMAMWRTQVVPNPPGRYLADPFVIERDGRTVCFAEDYDCKTLRGCISVAELAPEGPRFLDRVIVEPFHMSFPFLFEYQGQLFMCPETSESGQIRIYRCVDFPLKWSFEKAIMTGVRAADTMLFEKDGAWWMLTNIDATGTGDFCSDLFLFRADSPLSEHWTPHAANPVLVDAACARNGGLLREGDRIYRVSQKQGFDQYGAGSQVNEILRLGLDGYEERCVASIRPAFEDGLVGTHHLHSNGTTTVFDSLKAVSTAGDPK